VRDETTARVPRSIFSPGRLWLSPACRAGNAEPELTNSNPGTSSSISRTSSGAGGVDQTQTSAVATPPAKHDDRQAAEHETHVRLRGIAISAGYAYLLPGFCSDAFPHGPYYDPFSAVSTAILWDPFWAWYPPSYPAGYFTPGTDKGELKLTATPKNATVYLNGAYAGAADRLKSFWLDPRVYDLTVSSPDDGGRFEQRGLHSDGEVSEDRCDTGGSNQRRGKAVKKTTYAMAFATLWFAALALAGPRGTVPRAAASRYPAHAQGDGISAGAKLLSREEIRKLFVSDVNRCCLVLAVAVSPDQAKIANVSLNDFVLRVKDAETAFKPSSPKVVAASRQHKAQRDRDVAVYPTSGIGYSSGSVYDPATGTRQAGGVYTQAGVGVAIGSPSGPGVSDQDRTVMETELNEKGLPQGSASTAVAAYIYFSISGKKAAEYQLEYVSNRKLVLPVRVR
jgi:hypothetical protein